MPIITGTDNAETLLGAELDDTIIGAGGTDFIDGGGAFNIAAYWTSPFGIVVRLFANFVDNDGFFGQDTLNNISGIAGTGFDDLIYGNDLGNYMQGFSGDDWIETLGGDDLVRVSEGDDTVDGGTGTDRIFFMGARSEYTVTAITNGFVITDTVAGRDGTDTVLNVELFQFTNTQLTAGDLPDPNAPGDGLPYPRTETDADNLKPVVTAADQAVQKFAQPAASSLFSVSDPEGDAITAYEFWDSTAAAASGSFVVNGVVQGANVAIPVSAAQLGATVFRSGSGADDLWVRAFDGGVWSDWEAFRITAPVNAAPVATASSQTVARGATLEASTLFSASDPNGDAIAAYEFWDSTAGGGRFVVDGAEQGVNVAIPVSASELGDTSFVAANGGTDQLWVRASDGLAWSNWVSFNVDAVL